MIFLIFLYLYFVIPSNLVLVKLIVGSSVVFCSTNVLLDVIVVNLLVVVVIAEIIVIKCWIKYEYEIRNIIVLA